MKRNFVILISLFLLSAFATQYLNAQNIKFGHINSEELVRSLPEFDSASIKLQNFYQELVNEIELMQVQLNNKSDEYAKDSKNYSESVKKVREQELMDMNRRIQEFQSTATEEYQNKQVELFQPITEKVDKVIKDIGKENGFIYIFDVSKGTLLYFDAVKSTDIMPLAKAKLGLE